MIAVIFEFVPSSKGRQVYFELAVQLRKELAEADGFISIERFESLTQPGHFLSLSFWRDEAAVTAWRNRKMHRDAQCQGRAGVLDSYRLRVAAVLRDYGKDDRDEAPADSQTVHGG